MYSLGELIEGNNYYIALLSWPQTIKDLLLLDCDRVFETIFRQIVEVLEKQTFKLSYTNNGLCQLTTIFNDEHVLFDSFFRMLGKTLDKKGYSYNEEDCIKFIINNDDVNELMLEQIFEILIIKASDRNAERGLTKALVKEIRFEPRQITLVLLNKFDK